MPVTDIAQINVRKSTAAQWSVANTLLVAGEYGMETDTKLVKLGDGVTLWNALGYMPEQLAKQITSATSKATPVGADEIPLADSAATFGLKKLLLSNLKAYIFNAVTTAGDILYATAAGVVARLGIGTTGQVLTVAGGLPTWATPASGSTPAFVGAIVYGAVNLSYGTTNTAVGDLGTELIDTNGFHSGTDSRMTIPTGYGGKYRMELNITFAANDPTVRIFAYKNGAAITEGLVNGSLMALNYTAGALNGFSVGLLVTGVATDYFEFFIVNGGASKTVDKARYSFEYRGA